ncbi:TPA: hypothetical protein KB900_002252 [Enterococcus faecium]|jgi:hypothetical protein|uniref:hypothetical protein n=1 Tax=Enterococcus TaxID=1350 RepID=UPI001E3AAE5C|nr:hypothetical protein [Enterococcus durans]MCD5011103.1 hypothetical protein [Enterococcus durans]HBB6805947.1 hypothetical protein [Enterococcus faecium]
MDMEEQVKLWGLPKALKNKDIKYKFESKLTTDDGVKFSLLDGKEEVFIMSFYSGKNYLKLRRNSSPYLVLKFICVPNTNCRHRGISTFFLKKFLQFAKDKEYREIHLAVSPEQTEKEGYSLENGMNKEELQKYYKNFLGSDPDIKLIFK